MFLRSFAFAFLFLLFSTTENCFAEGEDAPDCPDGTTYQEVEGVWVCCKEIYPEDHYDDDDYYSINAPLPGPPYRWCESPRPACDGETVGKFFQEFLIKQNLENRCLGNSCNGPRMIPYVPPTHLWVKYYECKDRGNLLSHDYHWESFCYQEIQYGQACHLVDQICLNCVGGIWNEVTLRTPFVETLSTSQTGTCGRYGISPLPLPPSAKNLPPKTAIDEWPDPRDFIDSIPGGPQAGDACGPAATPSPTVGPTMMPTPPMPTHTPTPLPSYTPIPTPSMSPTPILTPTAPPMYSPTPPPPTPYPSSSSRIGR